MRGGLVDSLEVLGFPAFFVAASAFVATATVVDEVGVRRRCCSASSSSDSSIWLQSGGGTMECDDNRFGLDVALGGGKSAPREASKISPISEGAIIFKFKRRVTDTSEAEVTAVAFKAASTDSREPPPPASVTNIAGVLAELHTLSSIAPMTTAAATRVTRPRIACVGGLAPSS